MSVVSGVIIVLLTVVTYGLPFLIVWLWIRKLFNIVRNTHRPYGEEFRYGLGCLRAQLQWALSGLAYSLIPMPTHRKTFTSGAF
jgi:hypothetical protein